MEFKLYATEQTVAEGCRVRTWGHAVAAPSRPGRKPSQDAFPELPEHFANGVTPVFQPADPWAATLADWKVGVTAAWFNSRMFHPLTSAFSACASRRATSFFTSALIR